MQTNRSKPFLIASAVIVCIAIHALAWRVVFPNASAPDIPANGLNAPEFIRSRFGDTVALIFPPLVLAVSTIFGIVANILWTHAEDATKKIGWRSFAPLLVSPIALFSFYSAASSQPDGFTAALMAFQNGFFWQTVLSTRRSTTPASVPQ